MRMLEAPIGARALAIWMTLLLATTGTAWFLDTADAQVFKDGQACWEPSSCSPSSTEAKEQPYARVQGQKRATPAKDASKRTARTQVKKTSSAMASGSPDTPHSQATITHKAAIQVDQNDKAIMDLALNNARNIMDYYKAKRETVAVEIVTYGPGLHMLRADTSPVKERIATMASENPNLAFIGCGNSQANQSKAEGKSVTLISEAKIMPSGA